MEPAIGFVITLENAFGSRHLIQKIWYNIKFYYASRIELIFHALLIREGGSKKLDTIYNFDTVSILT